MLVTNILSDEEWQENHRTRQWLPLKQASSLIQHRPLQQMFTTFAKRLARKID